MRSLLLAFWFFLGLGCGFGSVFSFGLAFALGFGVFFFLFLLLVSFVITAFILLVFVFSSEFIISFMLDTKEVLKTVGLNLINDDSTDFEVVFELFSQFWLLFVGFEWLSSRVAEIDGGEEVEERFGLDLLGHDSLLSCLFILLFLLDLFDSEVFIDPFDDWSLWLDRLFVFQYEPLGQLLILDDFIVSKVKDNGEVISAFLIDHSDVFEAFQQVLVFLAKWLLDNSWGVETFPPISLDLSGLKMILRFFDLLFIQICWKVFQFLLCNGSFSWNYVGNLDKWLCTCLRTGASSLR